jgi:LysM repeat protein
MNQADEEYDDYGPEPNMKLSHAFLVVLSLHVVAVGGLYAFNSIKAGNHPVAKAEAKPAPVVEKTVSSGDNGSSAGGSGGSSGSGDQGGIKPPHESKPAPVAKVSNQTQATQSTEKPSQPSKGLLASARGMIQKAGIGGAVAAGSSKLAAQEPATATTASEPAPAGAAQTYTVKAGDTVTKIASSLGVTIPDLEKTNGLAGNTVLQVGQILKVPAQPVAPATSSVQTEAGKVAASAANIPAETGAAVRLTNPAATTSAAAPAPEQTAGGAQYTVVKGDSPYKIAKKFKITPDELMKANGITDPKKIQIGQVLRIPTSTAKAK